MTESLPSFFTYFQPAATIFVAQLTYTSHVQMIGTVAMAINRYTAVTYPFQYKQVNFIKKISGCDIHIRSVSAMMRKNEIKNVVANTSKIQKLGWKNETDILQGLQLTYNWFKNR